MYTRKAMKKAECLTICDVNILCISTNFRCMCNALPTLDKSKWTSASKAVVEHHVGNHDFCGSFCKWKTMPEEEKKLSDQFYRSKSTDAELYKWLSDLIESLTTMEKLEEIGHGMDTTVNDALNNIISWIVPKNNNYSGTVSLVCCIHMALSMHLVGFKRFFIDLFTAMQVEMTDGICYYLMMQQQHQTIRSTKSKTRKVK
jgi:hypothetical protein